MIISNEFELHVPNIVFWYFYSSSLGASAYWYNTILKDNI